MTTRKFWTACGLLALLTFTINGCGQSSPAPKQVAQTDKHSDHTDHNDGDGHDHSKDGKKPHDHSGWWCDEHGIPEAECSLCNSKVAAAFKAKGDWCDEHDRAKSQCFLCNPKLKEKYAAIYRAKEGKEPPTIDEEVPATESKKKGSS